MKHLSRWIEVGKKRAQKRNKKKKKKEPMNPNKNGTQKKYLLIKRLNTITRVETQTLSLSP